MGRLRRAISEVLASRLFMKGALKTSNKAISTGLAVSDGGAAHKLFTRFSALPAKPAKGTANAKGKKKAAVVPVTATGLTKAQLLACFKELQAQRILFFTSADARSAFVDAQHAAFDKDGDGILNFDEYLALYQCHLQMDADAALEHARQTLDEVAFAFVESDANADMALDKLELRRCLWRRLLPGRLAPADEALEALLIEVLGSASALDFAQFKAAYVSLCHKARDLQTAAEEAAASAPGFDGLLRDDDLEEMDLVALERATVSRYDQAVWIARVAELSGEEHEGGNALQRAAAKRKCPLLLRHPDQILDNMTEHLRKAGAKIVDVQELLVADPEKPTKTIDDLVDAIRDSLVECWGSGQQCVLRLGAAAPNFSIWSIKYPHLPLEFLTDGSQPGPLSPTLYPMLQSYVKATGERLPPADKFVIKPGFQLILCSNLNMHNYRTWMNGRIPVWFLQPIQVCSSISQVAAVLRDPIKAVPAEDMDAALDKMDRLADLL